MRIFERGREIRSTIRFYLRNVRLPEWLEADLRAMVGAVRAGADRLQDMTRTHGVDVVVPTLAEMIAYAERRTAAEIRALPDGVYEGESWIDSDGQGTHNIRIACTVTIEGDTIHVDYTGSDPQAGGHCNATVATMQACGSIPVLTIIDPTIPRNEGCTRRIRVTAPEGSVANARWPASTWWGTVNPGDILIEAAWKALAQAAPDRVPAGWGALPAAPLHGRRQPRDTVRAVRRVDLRRGLRRRCLLWRRWLAAHAMRLLPGRHADGIGGDGRAAPTALRGIQRVPGRQRRRRHLDRRATASRPASGRSTASST